MRIVISLATIILFLFSNCEEPESIRITPENYVHDYPNILNYKGIPENSKDRSVFAFSDLGAWFAYALPKDDQKQLLGSFVGPFLMTQDNGAWINPALTKLEIIDVKSGRVVNLENAEIIENIAFSGSLRQMFRTKEPELLVISELIFPSNRTMLNRIIIENLTETDSLKLKIRWSGGSFLEGVSFSEHENGIRIDFSKNENIGTISAHADQAILYSANKGLIDISIAEKSLKSYENWEVQLSHSFYFSEDEWKTNQVNAAQILKSSGLEFSINHDRWNANLRDLLIQIKPEFKDTSYQKILVKCLQTLNNNWRSSAGFLKHDGLFPSYNYEWFNGFWSWDSWKHAVALSYVYPDLAQNQIRAMYDFQDSMGMIADCVYRDTVIENHNWRDTKPPLSAWAVWEVLKHTDDGAFAKEMFPKLEKYHQWWYKYRDHDQNGLCEYGSTDGSLIAAKWESGMDNAVRFDDTKIVKNNEYGWSMNQESVDLNAYLFAEKTYLAKIADYLGEAQKKDTYNKEANDLKVKIQSVFYDEETGWFYDIDLDTKEHLKILGSEGWIPLWAKAATIEQAERVRQTIIDSTKFATYIPFPTLSADHPKFKPDGGYWRGPVWLDQAYFGIKGLKNYGYHEDASMFSKQLFDRLEGLKNDEGPIRENYHPLTGKGLESNHFSWSAAHLLLLLLEE